MKQENDNINSNHSNVIKNHLSNKKQKTLSLIEIKSEDNKNKVEKRLKLEIKEIPKISQTPKLIQSGKKITQLVKKENKTVECFISNFNIISIKPSNPIIAKYFSKKSNEGAVYLLNTNTWLIPFNLYLEFINHLKTASPQLKINSFPNTFHSLLFNQPIEDNNDSSINYKPHPIYSKLLSFQKEAVEFSIKRKGRVLLADDMGLGKTIQSLAIAQFYRNKFPLLIIAPASLLEGWKDSIYKFLSEDDDVVIIKSQSDFGGNISIISYNMATKFHETIKKISFEIVICDECHYLKNTKARRTTLLKPLISSISHLIMISGTPALSRPIELFPIISALSPKLFPNYNKFGMRYCDGKKVYIPGARKEVYDFKGSTFEQELKIILESSMMIRRLKKSVLHELPGKFRRHIVLNTKGKKIPFKLKVPGNLYKENDILGDTVGVSIMQQYSEAVSLKKDPVIEYLEDFIEKKIKFIVFAHHQEMIVALVNLCESKSIKYIKIDGSTPTNKRFTYINAFQEDESIQIAVLSLTACSAGITLTAATAVIFTELYWNPGTLVQAEDRIYRIGQKCCVDIHYLVCKGTIDEYVWPKILEKMEILEKIGVGENVYAEAKDTDHLPKRLFK